MNRDPQRNSPSNPQPNPQPKVMSYGPDAIITPANAVTIARLMISPLLFAMISDHGSWATIGLWTLLCVTDGIDGYLARKQ